MTLIKTGLLIGGAIAAGGGLLHVACVAGGPKWYQFFQAPPAIVQSAQQGTWLAPVSTIALGAAMVLAGAYAVSLAGLGPRLPFARTAVAAVALVCALRVVGTALVLVRRPDLFTPFETVASAVFLTVALTYAAGALSMPAAPAH